MRDRCMTAACSGDKSSRAGPYAGGSGGSDAAAQPFGVAKALQGSPPHGSVGASTSSERPSSGYRVATAPSAQVLFAARLRAIYHELVAAQPLLPPASAAARALQQAQQEALASGAP